MKLIWDVDADFIAKFTLPIAVGLIILALAIIFGAKTAFSTKETAFAAVALATSYALSFIKIFSMPQGGSVTPASMLPLLIFAYYFGWKKGLIVGIIYSILQIMQSPQIYHPLQVLLDYPLAFSSFFVVGFFRRLGKGGFFAGTGIYGVLRFLCHFLSGAVFFGIWAPEGMNVWLYSFVYNSTVLVELALSLVLAIFLFASNNFTNQMERFAADAKKNIYQR
ncbi:MAG TPA: energy-coupled thiamine transporter ThiT [Clostridiales bacterium]|nr:energy-coupled thiamine transporter ThiT [Clostridiales bacterium]